MASPFFRFKQFTIWHNLCAMKVGTDGVLLGAWAPIEFDKGQILDIGTGSGLIALMLAQRAPQTKITAIDIDTSAIEQANHNFSISPWKDRLECQQSALQEYEGNGIFDLIVSNPPYFQDSLKNPNLQRAMARHTDTLSFEDLLIHSARLIKPNGKVALILPIEVEEQIIAIARKTHLYPVHITHVFPKPNKEAKRILLTLSKILDIENYDSKRNCIYDSLTLESANAPRSEEYIELTKDFYL